MILKARTVFRRSVTAFFLTGGLLIFSVISPALAQDQMPPAPQPVPFPPPPAASSILMDSGSGSPMDIVHSTHKEDPGPDGDTHPLIRLTPDKSEIIHLDTSVRSLLVGNPTHLNVLMDSTKTLILVPREPGATHFTALDEQGRVIMQRHVIVGSPKESYIRIRRSCMNAGGGDCVETSVYYCPDMCHPVSIMSADQGQPLVSAAGSSGGSATLPTPAVE